MISVMDWSRPAISAWDPPLPGQIDAEIGAKSAQAPPRADQEEQKQRGEPDRHERHTGQRHARDMEICRGQKGDERFDGHVSILTQNP